MATASEHAVDGGPHARVLTYADVTELTGEDDHARLTELEIIFGPYEDIHPQALRQCWQLQTLTLLNCRLERVPGPALHGVRDSLVSLCLGGQCLTRIAPPLDLPNLRRLYLQQNQLTRIEGLERCRRLQVLWLYGNRLTAIENLGFCTDLRELWLQDNAIQSLAPDDDGDGDGDGGFGIGGLTNLVNLESLQLAKNRIRKIDEFQRMRHLINLRTLSFTDEHFGTNPITRHPDYRVVAISTLRHLSSLDGSAIDKKDRVAAVNEVLSQAIEFSDKLADLTLVYEHEIRAIHGRQQRGASNAEMLQKELMEALNDVESIVNRGKQELSQEANRQQKLRDRHSANLVSKVEALQERQLRILDGLVEEELRLLDEEDIGMEMLEQEAIAAKNLALTVATVQYASPLKIAFHHLSEHSAEFRLIEAYFHDSERAQSVGSNIEVLHIYQFYHDDLVQDFDSHIERRESLDGDGSAPASDTNGFAKSLTGSSRLQLFVVMSEDEAMDVLRCGFQSGAHSLKGTKSYLLFFSDPIHAVECIPGCQGGAGYDEKSNERPEEATVARMESYILLMCNVLVRQVTEATPLGNRMELCLDTIVSVADSAFSKHHTAIRFAHVEIQSKLGKMSDVYVANATAHQPILPEALILCSKRFSLLPKDQCKLNGSKSEKLEGVLVDFWDDLDNQIRGYHESLFQALEPETSKRLQEFEQTTSEAKQLSQRIEQEKKAQRQMLKIIRRRVGS